MSEHSITIGGATFYFRAAKGKDARHLFKFNPETGSLQMEQMLDPAVVAAFITKMTNSGDATTEEYLSEMPLQDFMQLVGKVYETVALTEDSAKNSGSSSTSTKTRKGEANLTARNALG